MRNQKLMEKVALVALATAATAGFAEKAHADVATSWSGAPRTTEEDRQFKINGRVQYDVYHIGSDLTDPALLNLDATRSFARRAFLGVEGRFTQHWRYNVKFDFNLSRGDLSSGPNQNPGGEVNFDDAYLEYAGDNFSIFLGQNNAIGHLEDRTSSNEIPFNERSSFDQAFVNGGKLMSIAFLTNGGNWSWGAALQGDSLNNPETAGTGTGVTQTNGNLDEQVGVITRGTWAPIYQRTPEGVTLLHLGAFARYRDNGGGPTLAGGANNGGSLFSYSARPNMASATGMAATVGTSSSYQHDTLYGAEVAFQYNAFGIEAEYAQLDAQSGVPAVGARADRSFNGGYVDLFWSPTGESRNYNAADGSFGRISPRRTLGSDGGIGHVMLSLRYDYLDLTDGKLTGDPGTEATAGKQTGYILGATWKPIAYVKLQLNYASYNVDRVNSSGTHVGTTDGDYDAITLRTQIDW